MTMELFLAGLAGFALGLLVALLAVEEGWWRWLHIRLRRQAAKNAGFGVEPRLTDKARERVWAQVEASLLERYGSAAYGQCVVAEPHEAPHECVIVQRRSPEGDA